MAYRFESSRVYESVVENQRIVSVKSAQNKSMQEINQAIWELGKKADEYAQASSLWASKAFEAALKAKQVFAK
ncbi:hypothetical protein [Bdellovibrio sp. HCB209]|uniref:hypothetical protein n=1 Tax=Bdellovibrio sp. HCB209 TaxID=3394354 RepID=UPI0039B39EA5